MSQRRRHVREDPDDITPSRQFPVQAFKDVGRTNPPPVFGREGHIGQNSVLRVLQHCRHLGIPRAERVGHLPQPLPGRGGVGQSEDPADLSGHRRLGVLRDPRRVVSHEVDAATLPTRPVNTSAMDRFRASWESELAHRTPRSPHATRPRRKTCQNLYVFRTPRRSSAPPARRPLSPQWPPRRPCSPPGRSEGP